MKDRIWKIIYGLLGLTGIISLVWGYETYLLTFINPIIPIAICLSSTVPAFFLIRKHYSELYNTNRAYYPFLVSITSVGFLVTSIFMIANHKFSESETIVEQFKIEESGTLSGKNKKPYAIINRGGQIKKLVFKKNPIIKPTDQIELIIQEGLLGFDVITEQNILKNELNGSQQ